MKLTDQNFKLLIQCFWCKSFNC